MTTTKKGCWVFDLRFVIRSTEETAVGGGVAFADVFVVVVWIGLMVVAEIDDAVGSADAVVVECSIFRACAIWHDGFETRPKRIIQKINIFNHIQVFYI